MDNIQIAELLIRRSAFITAANLVTCMNEYRYHMDENNRKSLDTLTLFSKGLPLPSGRWGNAIALALEINNYVAAEYLIENADRLWLDTNTVVSKLGGKNPWSLKDQYLYSQLTYDEVIMPKGKEQTDYEFQEYVDSIIRNKLANERLEAKFSITSEDKKLLGL